MTTIHSDGRRPSPPIFGALGYLLMNLPVGIAGFVALVTLFSVGVGTAVVWVGLPVLAVAIVLARGAARVERARVHAMLGAYIASPYAPLPAKGQWKARVKEGATWRDVGYFLLLFPIGVAEFVLMVTFWSVSLSLLLLPVYYRFLPTGSWRLWDWERPVLVVDSVFEALPFAALGLLVLAVSVVLTRGLASAHAVFARALLGPSGATVRSFGAWEPGFGRSVSGVHGG
ncbi:sensor domain-containing protein [Actinokineospora iranica]|uniref:Putative sensor n=1 Tax=Actinokineospora iranica TaxID=1271860 RepID=A0A1G6YH85_9PSEU|nr:sensor domain-containing protein [Actinokineospora iranica]SDD89077.1 Putative sensor [Actinokineospora iranica]